MPYGLRKEGDRTCVYNTQTGDTVPGGCHPDHASALRHQRAMMMNVPDARSAAMNIGNWTLTESGIRWWPQSGTTTVTTIPVLPEPIVAAAAPVKPSVDFFDQPEPDGPQPMSYTADGKVSGHLALYETCHRGFMNGSYGECVQAPRSKTDYAQFHLGHIETADGALMPVGKLTFDTNHAPLQADLSAAAEHYDNTGTVGAYVRARDGKYGIWLSGALRSDLTQAQVQSLRANPPSGDWRSLNRHLELVAALAVPVPGFPVQRALQASIEGSEEVTALILGGLTMEEIQEEEALVAAGPSYTRKKRGYQKAMQAAVLSTKARNALPRSAFAIPEDRAYPIQDLAHARNALARSAGKPEEGRVRRAVCRRYPDLCRNN